MATMPAATAAPEPLLEPPGVCARSQGLYVTEGSPSANSVVTVLPSTMPPASRNLATQWASCSGTKSAISGEPAVVSSPPVWKMSFRPMGTPCSGPRGPERSSSSAEAWAAARAPSRSTVTHACSAGS